MKACSLLLLLMLSFLIAVAQPETESAESLAGKWVRMTPSGPVGITFTSGGTAEVDFGNDGSTDVLSGYTLKDDTIIFTDRGGEMCPQSGAYRMECNDCYLAFDLVDDMCNGRIKMTLGFWTRSGYRELLEILSARLAESGNPEMYLARARVNLAMGNTAGARADLDEFIRHDASNAGAYINRAATQFPADLNGVVTDCNRAMLLEPENKNVWFLRGLAHYQMGLKEKACADFSRAIDLGFSILRIAEEQRCSEYWQEKE